MKQKINKILHSALLKDSLIYGVTNALFTGLPLLLMPFLVAVLNPEDYGKIDLFRSLTMIVTPIIGLSAVASLTRFYYDFDEQKFRDFTSSIIVLQIFNTFIAFILVTIANYFYKSEYITLTMLAILYFLFNQITEALLSIYRVKRMSKKYLVIRVGSVILDLSLLALFYYLMKNYDWTYRVFPNILSTILIGIISMCLLWKKFGIKFKLNIELLKIAISFSAPLIIHMISGYILNIGDRFFITYYLGEAELGNYSVAYQIGLAVSFFYTSFSLSWTPTFFEWMKSGKHQAIKKVKALVFICIPILGLLAVIAWYFLSRNISNFSKYDVKIELVIIITIAYVIYSFYRFNSLYYFYYKQTKVLSLITFSTGLGCVILYIILIPKYGILGAAIATLITFILMFVSTYIFKPNENIIKN